MNSAQKPDSTTSLSERHWLPFLVLITGVGAALRFYQLGTRSLWWDEASSVTFSRLPWWEFLRAMWYGEGNMSFYYLLLRGWLHLGDSESWLRGLSAIFGVATIPAVYQLGYRFLGRKAGLVAATLLAVNCFHIRYSQELRSYSLLALLLILSTYVFLSALETPRQDALWVAYVLLSSLAIYSHFFAVFVLAGQWLILSPKRVNQIGIVRLILTAAGITVLAAPMATVMLSRNQGQIDWVSRPTLRDALSVLQNFAGVEAEYAQISPKAILFLGFYLALLVVAVVFGRRDESAGSMMRVSVSTLLLWLAFPFVTMLGLSILKPVFLARYLFMCTPAAVLLAAAGLIELERRLPHGQLFYSIAFAVLVSLSLAGTRTYFLDFPTYGHDWRRVTSYITSQQQQGDGAIFYNYSCYRAVDYYVERQRELGNPVSSRPKLITMRLNQSFMEEQTVPYRRVWLILYPSEKTGEAAKNANLLRDSLKTHFSLAAEREFPGSGRITVDLYIAKNEPQGNSQ